jgi:hypothetical protein
MEILQLLCSYHYCPVNIPQLVIPINYSAISSQPPLQNSTELIAPTVLVITSRHGPHTKCRSSIVVCVFAAMETCLPSRCLQTVTVYSPYLTVVAWQQLYILQYLNLEEFTKKCANETTFKTYIM